LASRGELIRVDHDAVRDAIAALYSDFKCSRLSYGIPVINYWRNYGDRPSPNIFSLHVGP